MDYLRGLTENVTMAGTAFNWYKNVQVPTDEPPPPGTGLKPGAHGVPEEGGRQDRLALPPSG